MLVFANKQDMVRLFVLLSLNSLQAQWVYLRQAGALSSADIAEALDLGSDLFHVSLPLCVAQTAVCVSSFGCAGHRGVTGISNHAVA